MTDPRMTKAVAELRPSERASRDADSVEAEGALRAIYEIEQDLEGTRLVSQDRLNDRLGRETGSPVTSRLLTRLSQAGCFVDERWTGHAEGPIAFRLSEKALRVVADGFPLNCADNDRIKITLNNGQIGNVNLGTVVGNVEAHLSTVSGQDGAVGQALAALTQAVLDSEQVVEETRLELLQGIGLLSEEASKDSPSRRAGVTRPVLSALTASIAAIADLASIWATTGPILISFFS